ncbi:unnamed protein product [Orchesella dallaii]|uniref:Uncharacterized protein n=1 Tax=Orchesella dallaii TaxID=48710 RepID=A0ABP1RB95_9HEXA
MKAHTLYLALVVIFVLIAAVTPQVPHGAHGKALKGDISELNFFERILLRTTHPEVYNSWFGKSGKTPRIPDEDAAYVTLLNVDLPTLAIKLSNSEDAVRLPSLYYEFGFYYCFIGKCT